LLRGQAEFEQNMAASFPEPPMGNTAQRHQSLEIVGTGLFGHRAEQKSTGTPQNRLKEFVVCHS
jgi:hypothetical protein